MNTPILRTFSTDDFSVITDLFPVDWKFDFRKFINLHLGKSYFRAYTITLDSLPVGFGNLMIFGKTAWIGNIVIKKDLRNNGLGRILTGHLISEGKQIGIETFTLIATKLGEPVYRKLGFENVLTYEFYNPTENVKKFEIADYIKSAGIDSLNKIAELDEEIMGEKRRNLLKVTFDGTKIINDIKGGTEGIFVKNLGNGLIISKNVSAGIELLKLQVNDLKNVVISEKNKAASQFLLDCGYNKYMDAPRMILGKPFLWKPEFVFSRGAGYSG